MNGYLVPDISTLIIQTEGISLEDIARLLHNIDSYKATGPNDIPATGP